MKPLRTAARAMLGAIFVVDGARSVAKPDYHDPQAKQVTDWITPVLEKTSPSIPTDTRTLIRINGAIQLAGGLLLIRSRYRRPAAVALTASLVPTTLAAHPFWNHHDPEQRRNQQLQFLKNLGLFGGLLLAAVDNEGRPGLLWRGEHLVQGTRDSAARQMKVARRAARFGRLVGSVKGRLPG